MSKAEKLPSGSWRVRVYSHTDPSGKKIRRSFTAPTKKQAEQAAAIWSANHHSDGSGSITVSDAITRYIDAKRAVLSPSTVRGYLSMAAECYGSIGSTKLDMLKSSDLQIWISDLSKDHKPKSVRNIYGLLTAAVKMFAPDLKFNVTLPSVGCRQYRLPTDEDIQRLLDHTQGTRLWIALMLARYYSLRRSEICALTSDDLDGDILTISKAVVLSKENQWIVKQPKTRSSYRTLQIADPVLTELRQIDGAIIDCNPDALIDRFRRALKAAKVDPFNFHLLRHKFASDAALSGIPDFYTASFGGWRPGSIALKQIYQNVTDQDRSRIMDQLNQRMQEAQKKSVCPRKCPRKKKTPVNTEVLTWRQWDSNPSSKGSKKVNNYGSADKIRASDRLDNCNIDNIMYEF